MQRFRRAYDGLLAPPREFAPEEQLDKVERAGYRTTEQMVSSLLRAGERLVQFRAAEFDGVLTPDPLQGHIDPVDVEAAAKAAIERGRQIVMGRRRPRGVKNEAQAQSAPEGDGSS